MNRTKTVWIATLFLAAVLTLSGCGATSPGTTNSGADPNPVPTLDSGIGTSPTVGTGTGGSGTVTETIIPTSTP